MPGNSIGYLFRLTTFGESHGPAIGGVIDGCPAGLEIDTEFIQSELARRKPLYPGSTGRKEPDNVEFLSGILNGKTLGSPIAYIIRNVDVKSSSYDEISGHYRPSHADFTYEKKYGTAFASGGGRASGRETAARVVAGSIAKLLLKKTGIEISAYISQLGNMFAVPGNVFRSPLGFASEEMEREAVSLIMEAERQGDTLGGTISCVISGTLPGLGEPVFDKLPADLAKAMLSIGSAKAFEYGLGFAAASLKGSEYNDRMTVKEGRITFLSNNDGGIQGGISNGEDILFRVGFKPVPSVKMPQDMVNKEGENSEITISGRHDTCHIPRLVVIVESMAALVMADHYLRNSTSF
jgi:chorismate synthase